MVPLRNYQKTFRHQAGLSVTELLVAMVIGLIVMSGVMKVFTNTRASYDVNDALLRIQESGQYGIMRITRDLRSSGYWGCVGDHSSIKNLLDPTGAGYSAATHGFQHGVDGMYNVSGGVYISGTDTLIANTAGADGADLSVQTPFGPTTLSPIKVPLNSGIGLGESVLVTNCIDSDIFQVTNSDANTTGNLEHAVGVTSPGNVNNQLSTVYQGIAHVYRLSSIEYSIRPGANGSPALFRASSGVAQELVPDVETMKVLYGEDTDSDGVANKYVNATAVTDMKNIVSLRVALVTRTEETHLAMRPQPFTIFGVTTTPTDRRLRRVYTATINLRNHTL